MAELTLCPIRDECWRNIASKDGTGAVVRSVPADAKRPNLCGYEGTNTTHLCAKMKSLIGA